MNSHEKGYSPEEILRVMTSTEYSLKSEKQKALSTGVLTLSLEKTMRLSFSVLVDL
jgi:hypothetical protein